MLNMPEAEADGAVMMPQMLEQGTRGTMDPGNEGPSERANEGNEQSVVSSEWRIVSREYEPALSGVHREPAGKRLRMV